MDNKLTYDQGYDSKLNAEFVTDLIAAHKEFKPAVRDAANEFFDSKYVTLDGAWDAVKDALFAHNLMVIQTVQIDSQIGPVLMTELLHKNGVHRVSLYPIRPAKEGDPQAFASCTTYARRYGLMGIAMICPEDDDGNAAAAGSGTKAAAPRAAKPTGSANTGTPVQVVSAVTETKMSKAGKPYTQHTIAFSDGTEWKTFDGGLKAMAESAKNLKIAVTYETQKEGKYTNLTAVNSAGEGVVEVDSAADLPF